MMSHKTDAAGLPGGIQTVLVTNLDARCDNCRSPLSGMAYQRRRQVICAGCCKFLQTMEPASHTDDPLSVACPNCKAPAGERCRNYKGQNKQACTERG